MSFVDGEHQAVGSLGAGELLEVGFELFRLSLQIDGLAQKPALSRIATIPCEVMSAHTNAVNAGPNMILMMGLVGLKVGGIPGAVAAALATFGAAMPDVLH